MLGLCCNKTYGAMTKYDYRDNARDNDRNKDGNYDKNAATGSGSDGPIFDPITTPCSHRGGSDDYGNGDAATANYVSKR